MSEDEGCWSECIGCGGEMARAILLIFLLIRRLFSLNLVPSNPSGIVILHSLNGMLSQLKMRRQVYKRNGGHLASALTSGGSTLYFLGKVAHRSHDFLCFKP